jgi:hypothetical protein
MSNCCNDFSCPKCKAREQETRRMMEQDVINDYITTGRVKNQDVLNRAAAESELMALHLATPWQRPVPLPAVLRRDFWKRNKQIQDRVKAKAQAKAEAQRQVHVE